MIDTTDKLILFELQKDCKQTHKALSLKLNLSPTAIYERIKKLERSGIINNYVALLDRTKVALGLTVFCHIKLTQHKQDILNQFESAVTQLTEVLEVNHVSGDYDYLLKVVVSDMDHFRNFMVTKLTKIKDISSTQSSFSISEVKSTTSISL